MFGLSGILKKNTPKLTNEEIVSLLKTNPEVLKEFEKAYSTAQLVEDNDNFFTQNAKDYVNKFRSKKKTVPELIDRIIEELMEKTQVYSYDRENELETISNSMVQIMPEYAIANLVTNEEINSYPPELRPQLTGSLMKMDISANSYEAVLFFLKKYLDTGDINHYYRFKQGLDILDLDPLTYEILGMNRNSMGNWLPKLIKANENLDFFKIPSTKILKVPMTLLQLTRQPYESLTETTKAILDKYVYKVFELNDDKSYFIKTGTYSSKYDFRNAKVTSPKEVRELGEYLLFIHYQALQMASPLSSPCIPGVSTTNEWVVREFIEDSEDNLTIYNGLPLRTEFRVFIDCDKKEVLSVANYWDPEVMNKRFEEKRNVTDIHDAVTYKLNEERLLNNFNENKDKVASKVSELLENLELTGQWSLDIMKNGDDFWLVDMAVAEESFYYETVPVEKRILSTNNWLPRIEK